MTESADSATERKIPFVAIVGRGAATAAFFERPNGIIRSTVTTAVTDALRHLPNQADPPAIPVRPGTPTSTDGGRALKPGEQQPARERRADRGERRS